MAHLVRHSHGLRCGWYIIFFVVFSIWNISLCCLLGKYIYINYRWHVLHTPKIIKVYELQWCHLLFQPINIGFIADEWSPLTPFVSTAVTFLDNFNNCAPWSSKTASTYPSSTFVTLASPFVYFQPQCMGPMQWLWLSQSSWARKTQYNWHGYQPFWLTSQC